MMSQPNCFEVVFVVVVVVVVVVVLFMFRCVGQCYCDYDAGAVGPLPLLVCRSGSPDY